MRQKTVVMPGWTWVWACVFAGMVSSVNAAGPAHLIKDIDPTPLLGESDPQEFFTASDAVYFVAHDRSQGYGLWKSDGTQAGTVLVKSIYLLLGPMTQVGSTVFFVGGDIDHGYEIWKTDGTTAGTAQVKDINPGSITDNTRPPSGLIDLDGTLLFFDDDGTHGRELWRSDGTEAGTAMVKDIVPGPAGLPDGIAGFVFDHRLYFSVCLTTCGVWQSDGTAAGTVPWLPHGESLPPSFAQPAGGLLFFDTNVDSHWSSGVTDGTPEGTHHVFDGAVSPMAVVNGLVLLAIDDGVHGSELWRSDGTEAGTALVKDILPGTGSGVYALTTVTSGGFLYFMADDGVHGQELWSSDGSEAGTSLVKDINAGPGGTSLDLIADIAGRVLFFADDGEHGQELWRSDGTEAGTFMVEDVYPGPLSSGGYWTTLTPFHGAVLLAMNDGVHGMELWRTDGTAAGTALVKDIDPFVGTWGSGPTGLTPVGRSIVMTLNPPGYFGPGPIWRSDGTDAGTFRLGEVYANLAVASTVAGGLDYFYGYDDGHGFELWRSDGTAAGTFMTRDACVGPVSCNGGRGAALGDRYLYPSYDPAHGNGLWMSDGSEAGTGLVSELPGAAFSGAFVLGGDSFAFLSAPAAPGGTRVLWRSDGTARGTHPVGNVPVRGNSESTNRLVSGGRLFFTGGDAAHGNELWSSDGTEAGTALVRDLTPGTEGGSIELFTEVAGTLYLFKDLPGSVVELWRSDGTASGTGLVRDLGVTSIDQAVAAGGLLYFTALRADRSALDLWRSDGTAAGTRALHGGALDVASNLNLAPPLAAVDGVLLFSASDGVSGYELWRSDGTDEGTFLVQDIAPGEDWSNPSGFVTVGDRVFFSADDIVHGRELWGGRAAVVTAQPRLAVQDLRGELQALTLPAGIANGLGAKIDAASKALDRGAATAAAGALGAFSNEVAAQSGKTIASPDAEELLGFAAEILELLRSGPAPQPLP